MAISCKFLYWDKIQLLDFCMEDMLTEGKGMVEVEEGLWGVEKWEEKDEGKENNHPSPYIPSKAQQHPVIRLSHGATTLSMMTQTTQPYLSHEDQPTNQELIRINHGET